MKIQLNNVRLCFADVFAPGGDFNRYGAAFPIEPNSKNQKIIEEAMAAEAEAKWPKKGAVILAGLVEDRNVCFFKRPPKNKDGEVYQGFEGMYVINTSNASRPTVVDRDRTPLTEKDGRVYNGCYVNALLEIWAQDNQYGRRINCTLRGIQFSKDGEAFGGGKPASVDEFEDLGDGADAEDDLA